MTRLEANRLIIKLLSGQVEAQPDIRFSQLLLNMGIVIDEDIYNKCKHLGSINSRYWKDEFYLESADRPNKSAGRMMSGTIRQADGTTKPQSNIGEVVRELGQRFNIWDMPGVKSRKDTRHPAPFPLALAKDHVLSWSNSGDVVLDLFLGSGTSGEASIATGRRFIGIEKQPGYFEIAAQRLDSLDGTTSEHTQIPASLDDSESSAHNVSEVPGNC